MGRHCYRHFLVKTTYPEFALLCCSEVYKFYRDRLIPNYSEAYPKDFEFVFAAMKSSDFADDMVNAAAAAAGKAVPLQAWTGPEGSRKLRLPDFVKTAQDSGRLSALRTGLLYPQKYSWYSFLLEAESTPGP